MEDASYYGVMPFNRSLREIEDRIRLRSASVEPVSTYTRAYRSTTPYGGYTSYDYKVLKRFWFIEPPPPQTSRSPQPLVCLQWG